MPSKPVKLPSATNPGKVNPADLLTKEHRDVSHFRELRDILVPEIVGVGGGGGGGGVGIDNVMDKDEVARRGRTTSHETTMTRPKTQTKKVSWADVVRGSHRQ